MKLHKFIILLPLILSACAMFGGPEYSQPNINIPDKWEDNTTLFNAQESASDIAALAWWQRFNDPELNQLIKQVLANNTNLAKASANITVAQNNLKIINSQWIPTINLGGGNLTGNLPSLLINGFGNYIGLTANYNLNVASQIDNHKIGKLNIKLQQAQLNALRLTLLSQTVSTYYRLIAANQQLALFNEVDNDLLAKQKLFDDQLQKGLISNLEVSDNEQKVLDLEAKIPQIRQNITTLQDTLQVLLNHNPGTYSTVTNLSAVKIAGVLPQNLSTRVLLQRPDIMIAGYNLQIANAKIGAAYSNFFPTLNIFAPVGVENLGSFENSNFFGSTYWLSFISASVPVLNFANYAKVDKAKAEYQSQADAYVSTVRSAFGEVQDGISWQKNSADSLKLYSEKLAVANQAYRLALIRFQKGAVSYESVLDYKLQQDTAQDGFNQSKLEQINSLINLYQVLGSGYQIESSTIMSEGK